jgi:hypothetical protein
LILSRRRETLLNGFGLLPLGRSHSFAVPACPACAKQLRRRYRIDVLLTFLAGSAAGALALLAYRLWHLSRTWTLIGGVAAFTMALAARNFLAPPAFDFTVERNHIEFAFANAEYAMVFRTQNTVLGVSGFG